jgi:putative transposase
MTQPVSYKRHRFPAAIIAQAVWLYFRFPLSLRLIEEMLLERGIVVSYETMRRWALKFGQDYARRLGRKTPSRYDIWHLDEVVIRPPPDHARSRAPLAQESQQSRRELSLAAAPTRTRDAEFPITGRVTEVHLCFFCHPQPVRSTPLPPLCPCHPSAPPHRHGGMKSRGGAYRLSQLRRPSCPRHARRQLT